MDELPAEAGWYWYNSSPIHHEERGAMIDKGDEDQVEDPNSSASDD